MNKLVSEDSARRAFKQVDQEACHSGSSDTSSGATKSGSNRAGFSDVDATVKPLYGSQQGGQLGHHPAKPGRPSHAYHAYMAGS